ncbi:unnamed protein product [marine sediment metagenome]|uniref:Uncharacterized protein n=1 Tax=marine sediment metagenome TaxID=412755 RepID=X1M7V5_9ZZZZ
MEREMTRKQIRKALRFNRMKEKHRRMYGYLWPQKYPIHRFKHYEGSGN